MSNEYEDDNKLASLPTFKSNPGKRSETVQDAPPVARPSLWESATMADVRDSIEVLARELGASRYDVLSQDVLLVVDNASRNGASLDPKLTNRFYSALATYHGQADASAMRFDPAHESVVAALAGLKALDAAEPVSPAVASVEVSSEPAVEARMEPEDAATAMPGDDMVKISRVELDALRRAADTVNAKGSGQPEVSAENIAEAAEAIRQGKPSSVAPASSPAPSASAPGLIKTNVGEAAAQMTQGALSAGASLIGGALRGTVGALRKGVEAMRPEFAKEESAGPVPEAPGRARPMVLPRLSEYRVSQIEDQANKYAVAQDAFWDAGKMPDVRKAIEEKARETGMSVEDVMEKMKPGGEMHELQERFVDAYNHSPDAVDHRKVMNKAIDGFVRQYGQAQEEMLAPDQQGAEYFEGYKERVEGAKDRIFKKAGHVPLLDGENKTHLQKLQEAVAKIIEKVREMISGFTNMLRGKGGAVKEAVSEPTP